MSLPASTVASTQHALSDLRRPGVNFPPTIWGDFFLQYASQSLEVNDHMRQRTERLKEEVKKMFESPINQNITQKLILIDTLQRLGVTYHFQPEIIKTFGHIHSKFTKNSIDHEDFDFNSLALLFRLLRQERYQMSSDVFSKLKNEQGKFSETLANDLQGLCSLFEAANMRTKGDDILEEAYNFTHTHLKSFTNKLTSPSLVAQINHCLSRPFNKSVLRNEVRYHITLYEQDPSHNQSLLNFAKVDFNILQKLHQKEIGSVTKWWKKSNIITRVPYARDRLVEAYLWPLATSFMPKNSKERMFGTKLTAVLSLIDDTYDNYGTVEELQLFTEAIHRWDISPIRSLPQCMRVVFETTVELCQEMEMLTADRGKPSFVVPHFKQAFVNLTKAYMVEARWCHEGYIPTYDEYKVNGALTSTLPLMITSFIGLGEFATEYVFDWIFSDPNLIKAISAIGRLLDDVASHKFEQQRVHVASAVECCMKQYSISEEEAYVFIRKDVEDYWKVINEEYLRINDIPKYVLDCVVNLARISEFKYENFQDRYTNGELVKECVSSLLVDSISI